MNLQNSAVKSATVDYITATTGERKANTWLAGFGERLLRQEMAAGNDTSSFWLHSLAGLSCGSVQLATSMDRVMIRLSSHLAAKYWQRVAQRASNISRLDLQTTIHVPGAESKLAARLERRALRYVDQHDSRLTVELRRNNRTGQTLYLGSRTSDSFSRIYDKGKESKLPELKDHWRGELELHRAQAMSAATVLLDSEDTDAQLSVFVQQHLQRRGVTWPALKSDSQLVAQLPISQRVQSSRDRKLMWLRSQVAPTIRKLLVHMDQDELMHVLGFDASDQEE
jgi:DNA relaxase NicK